MGQVCTQHLVITSAAENWGRSKEDLTCGEILLCRLSLLMRVTLLSCGSYEELALAEPAEALQGLRGPMLGALSHISVQDTVAFGRDLLAGTFQKCAGEDKD